MEIENITIQNIPECLRKDLELNKDLIKMNMDYLKDLGVSNYQEVFKTYYAMFLMDPSNFSEIFNKYDRKDLVDKIEKNIAIVEHL